MLIFFGFGGFVHEISALNADGSAFLVCPWGALFFNCHHSLFFPACCFIVIPSLILYSPLPSSEVKLWNFSLLNPNIISAMVPFFNTLVVA